MVSVAIGDRMCAREEVDFAEEAQTWGGICISEKGRDTVSARPVAALVHPSHPISQSAKKEIFIGREVIVERGYVRCPGNDLLQGNFLL